MSAITAMTRGLLSGLVGTVAMTISEMIEMRVTGREASTVPAQVGSKLLGVHPDGDEQMGRLNAVVHWGHGALLGATRGLMSITGLRGLPATLGHFAAFWIGDVALYKLLGIAPAPWRWNRQELVIDVLHKGVYALVTGAAYEKLAGRR